jgi:hypothetical protein
MESQELHKNIVLACQDAWKQEGNTTINKMIEWILLHVLPDMNQELEELKSKMDTVKPSRKIKE